MCAALLLTACGSGPDSDTIWPPADFEVAVEEATIDGVAVRPERRFRARADGVASYATASEALVDAETGTALPLWTRISVYRLVPTCTRALARRIHRAGVLDLEPIQGQREGDVDIGAALRWRAFDRRVAVSSRGRVHGPMAEILAIIGAHLPDGERFETPGVAERAIASVLRGVPAPRDDAAGALMAHVELLKGAPEDPALLLDTFALACRLERRELAEHLLGRWQAVAEPPSGEGPRLTPEILRRLLPGP